MWTRNGKKVVRITSLSINYDFRAIASLYLRILRKKAEMPDMNSRLRESCYYLVSFFIQWHKQASIVLSWNKSSDVFHFFLAGICR